MTQKKKEEQPKDVQYTSEKRRVFYAFNEEDINVLNAKVAELADKKEKFSNEAKLHADIAKGCQAEITVTLAALKEGGEEREAECPVTLDFKAGTRTVRHPETNELLYERPLTADERQQPLFEDNSSQAAPTAAPQAPGTAPQLPVAATNA